MFRGTLRTDDGEPHENTGYIRDSSVALVRFYIMALEVGVHELRFTLRTRWGEDTVVKTLRVVVSMLTLIYLTDTIIALRIKSM